MRVKQCPNCHHTIINQLVDYCLYCKKDLPKRVCLSDQQKHELLTKKRAEYERIRKRDAVLKKLARPPLAPGASDYNPAAYDTFLTLKLNHKH